VNPSAEDPAVHDAVSLLRSTPKITKSSFVILGYANSFKQHPPCIDLTIRIALVR